MASTHNMSSYVPFLSQCRDLAMRRSTEFPRPFGGVIHHAGKGPGKKAAIEEGILEERRKRVRVRVQARTRKARRIESLRRLALEPRPEAETQGRTEWMWRRVAGCGSRGCEGAHARTECE